jgi:erythromycin esterase
MLQPILLLLAVFTLYSCDPKEIKTYVTKKTAAVRTVDPLDTNYNDLSVIGDAIGDARVVMLGEQDHGDAPTFLAKTRIIKYLHEKKGFNVLAFESDFYGLNKGWDEVQKTNEGIDSFAGKNIFRLWTWCDACSELFHQYIHHTHNQGNPLQLSGFDSQMTLHHSGKNLAHSLDSVLTKLDLPITKQPVYRTVILPYIDSIPKIYKEKKFNDVQLYKKIAGYAKQIQGEISTKLDKNDFWRKVADNLVTSIYLYLTMHDEPFWISNNVRDSQMAQNLAWVTETKYPKEKVIVWAADAHIAKAGFVANAASPQGIAMGFYYSGIVSTSVYTLGFSSYRGTAGRLTMPNIYTLAEPDKNGFENWIDTSYQYAFTDFTSYNKNHPQEETFHATFMGHRSSDMRWNKMFDGIFFIRDMYPCKK